jgi:hypothetical protein
MFLCLRGVVKLDTLVSRGMPKFIKKKTGVGSPVARRHFVVRSTRTMTVKKPRVAKSTSVEIRKKADSTLDSLNILLEQDHKARVTLGKRDEETNAIFVDEPASFDGISNSGEAQDLYTQALSYERKKARSVEDHIKAIETEGEKEKKELEAQIRELKRELHRTAPLHDTKFFSLSKELKSAIEDLERVADYHVQSPPQAPSHDRQIPLPAQAFVAPAQPPVMQKIVSKPVESASISSVPAVVSTEPEAEKKSLTKKKVLVTGVSAVVLILMISGLAGAFMSQPSVDEKLVAEYLPQAGQVQGAESQQASPAEPDPSQADISFEQSVWDDYNDGAFGITLQYPKNAVKVIRTDSNVTFIRKTGYLFKVQRIETSFTVDEYWKQIKSTSLNFVATSEKFKGKVALKLELEDMTDYPGDRYLIKEGDFIYDVWYATPSNNFSTDDIKLAEKMLASLSIIEVVEF